MDQPSDPQLRILLALVACALFAILFVVARLLRSGRAVQFSDLGGRASGADEDLAPRQHLTHR